MYFVHIRFICFLFQNCILDCQKQPFRLPKYVLLYLYSVFWLAKISAFGNLKHFYYLKQLVCECSLPDDLATIQIFLTTSM